jgi:hypothetical protein
MGWPMAARSPKKTAVNYTVIALHCKTETGLATAPKIAPSGINTPIQDNHNNPQQL